MTTFGTKQKAERSKFTSGREFKSPRAHLLFFVKMKKKLWFKAKHYGWGWYPCSWEGGLVLLIFVLLVIFALEFLNSVVFKSLIIAVTFIILMVVCWKTGERPRWRWG